MTEEAAPEYVRDEKVRRFRGVVVADVRADIAADFFEGSGDSPRIPRKLHRRGVGEIFPLPRDRGPDDIREELPDQSDEKQNQADRETGERKPQHGGLRVVVFPAGPRRIERYLHADTHRDIAEDGEHLKPEQNSDQFHVQPGVLIEDMAEFMADDPLQFVAGQVLDGALGDGDDAGRQGKSGGERVDRRFPAQNVDVRRVDSGGDRHLLNDVQQTPFPPGDIRRLGQSLPPEVGGDPVPVEALQLGDFVEGSPADDQGDGRKVDQKKKRVAEGVQGEVERIGGRR